LLGAEQSGFIADMGFETYQRILAEAVEEIRAERGLEHTPVIAGGKSRDEFVTDCTIDTDLEILIPDDYVSMTAEKIRLYKEMDTVESEKELAAMFASMEDRFGPAPQQTRELADTVRLRWLAMELGFEKIVLKNNLFIGYFISNQMSGYYKSARFESLLNFIQRQNRRFELKEQNEKLYVIIKRVDSIEKAYKLLYEMK
jgi:transcription-repair coupling factor (superfamily II helicase)